MVAIIVLLETQSPFSIALARVDSPHSEYKLATALGHVPPQNDVIIASSFINWKIDRNKKNDMMKLYTSDKVVSSCL